MAPSCPISKGLESLAVRVRKVPEVPKEVRSSGPLSPVLHGLGSSHLTVPFPPEDKALKIHLLLATPTFRKHLRALHPPISWFLVKD